MPREDKTTAAFGIYPKQRAKSSSPETVKEVNDLVKLLGDIILPKDAVDIGLMALPVAGPMRKLGAALIAGGASTDAEAGGLSALMRLLSKETPAQARQIREALGRAYTTNLEHSVVGSADKGPVGSIVSGTFDSVAPNQLDIARALKSDRAIADFHTHPVIGQTAFDISPSSTDFKFSSNEYFPGKQNRELRTIIASPADPSSRSPTAYSFFATDNPGKAFNSRNLKDAVFELQRAGSKGTFKSVLDDPRFREYFDYGGSMGELAENIAPLSLLDLRKSQGIGRGEVVLSGRPLSQNRESTNTELFRIMNPSAVELLTRKGFAEGGAVHMDEGGAAFGVFPQMKPRRAQQDRTAAANAPLSALRGWAAGTAGLPGDIEGLARAGISQLPPQLLTAFPALRAFGIGSRADPTPQLPTTEFYNEYLPGAQLNATPTGKAFTTAGNLLGGAGSTTLARYGIKSAKATAKAIAEAAPGPASGSRAAQLGVIKMPGGNFLKGEVEDSMSSMKRANLADPELYFQQTGQRMPEAQLNQTNALNTFIDKKIVPYIKNEMATPDDPLRAMAEKYAVDKPVKLAEVQARIDAFAAKMEQTATERGVPVEQLTSMRQQMIGLEKEKELLQAREGLHFTPEEDAYSTPYIFNRSKAGTDIQGMSQSPSARRWENASDSALSINTAADILRYKDSFAPWLSKVPPETKVYRPRNVIDRTGFDHLVDELRNATNPASGLPANLLIDPADLGKFTMPQAVDRVADINAWRATQRIEANQAIANNAATQVVKEYPEQGLKWVELKMPETLTELPPGYKAEPYKSQYSEGVKILNPAGEQVSVGETLDDAFKNMNELRLEDALKYEGDTMQHCVGGYCQDVVEGRSKIYSLRDANGQPRVTIEVGKHNPNLDFQYAKENLAELYAKYRANRNDYFNSWPDFLKKEAPELLESTESKIIQIKGFRNKKPADEFLPMVQDFVKSGNWSEVNDLKNAGLHDARAAGKAIEGRPAFMTDEELKAFQAEFAPKPEGMAQGGLVSNHFDPIKIKQIIAGLDDEYDPENIQQIIAQRESAYA